MEGTPQKSGGSFVVLMGGGERAKESFWASGGLCGGGVPKKRVLYRVEQRVNVVVCEDGEYSMIVSVCGVCVWWWWGKSRNFAHRRQR